jgi:hypothetical protein
MYNILSIGRASVFVMPCLCSSITAWLVSYFSSSITAWLVSYLTSVWFDSRMQFNRSILQLGLLLSYFEHETVLWSWEQTSIDNLQEKEVVCEYLMLCRTTPLPTLTIYDTSFFLSFSCTLIQAKFTNLTYGVWHCNVQQARPLTRRHIRSGQGNA